MTSPALTYARLLVAELEAAEQPKQPEPLEVRLAKICHDGQVRVNGIVDDACRELDALGLEFVPKVIRQPEKERQTLRNQAWSAMANQLANYDYQKSLFQAMRQAPIGGMFYVGQAANGSSIWVPL